MRICKIDTDKKRYLELLLLADEQESMIDRYLERGDLFVMYHSENEPVCSAVITEEGDGVCELKSLAVAPQYQRKGYGSEMVRFLCTHYAHRFQFIIVGTGESQMTVSFYKSCGFHYSHLVPDFFTLHYDHPIIEDGKRLKDMLYFKKPLVCPNVVHRDKRTNILISSLTGVWERSVRASHDFLAEEDIQKLIPAVREALEMIANLVVLYHGDDPVGFIGMEDRKVEMLFLAPEYWGYGLGTLLINMAIKDYGCVFVDVNEQNPKARSFYTHMGFREYERTETDNQGNPFPIIRMRLADI